MKNILIDFSKKNLLEQGKEYDEPSLIMFQIRIKGSEKSFPVFYAQATMIIFEGETLEQVQALNDILPAESRLLVRRMYFNQN